MAILPGTTRAARTNAENATPASTKALTLGAMSSLLPLLIMENCILGMA